MQTNKFKPHFDSKKISLDNIIEHFVKETKKPLELEIRFHNNKDIWVNLYEKIIAEYKKQSTIIIEESIIIILNIESGSNRKEIYYINGKNKGNKFISKKPIYKLEVPSDVINYKISLSSEEQINEFDARSANEIRLRLRTSVCINHDDIKDWRIDFTFVKTLNDSSQFQNVVKYRDIMFPITYEPKIDNILQHIDKIVGSNLFGLGNDPQITHELELEYIGNKNNISNDSVNKALKFIFNLLSPEVEKSSNYHTKLYEVAKILLSNQDTGKNNISELFKSKFVLKQLANQPINFTYNEYIEKIVPNIDQYYLSDKADGDRCFILIEALEDFNIYIIGSHECINVTKFILNFKSKFNFNKNYFKNITVLDAEFINLKDSMFEKAYIFDVLVLNGEKLTDKIMEQRNTKLDEICKNTGDKIQKKILIRLSSNGSLDSDYRVQIKNIYERKYRLYPVDGLIFTPNFSNSEVIKYIKPENYFDMVVYKWKPPSQMTIDFMVMKAPKKLLGIKPYIPKENHELYLLFCGIKYKIFKSLNMEYISEYKSIFDQYKFSDTYFPIQFSPSIYPYAYIYYHPMDFKLDDKIIGENDLHGHVVEFKYNCHSENFGKDKCLWIIEKLRPDRDINIAKGIGYGNDFITAESTFQSYQNPLTLDMLINTTGGAQNSAPYFATQKSLIYKPLTKFNAFSKSQMIRQLENCEWVIDLASGKGQDLFVYNGFKIKNCLFIERDKDALEELNRRKYELDKKEFYVYNSRPNENLSVYTKNADLTTNYEQLIELISDDIPLPQKGVNGIVINFAIHYIITDKYSLNNFVNLINNLLKKGGIFIFTCFNGNKINDLLRNIEYEKSWDLYDNNQLKYSITKKYNDEFSDTHPFGHKISVIHPFSAGEYYDENLLNINVIIDEFKNRGFILRQNGSFGDWLPKFKQFNNKLYGMLSKNDILYASLYQYVSLWKPV